MKRISIICGVVLIIAVGIAVYFFACRNTNSTPSTPDTPNTADTNTNKTQTETKTAPKTSITTLTTTTSTAPTTTPTTPTTTPTTPPQTTANTAQTTENTTPKTADEEYKQRINSMANSLYLVAESLVSVYQTVGIEIDRDYYYSNDNTEISKQISERLGTVHYPDGEIFDFSDGWAIAITTERYNNIEPGTVIGAVVVGKNNIYGISPNNPSSENFYPDIETALKDTATFFLNKPTIIGNE